MSSSNTTLIGWDHEFPLPPENADFAKDVEVEALLDYLENNELPEDRREQIMEQAAERMNTIDRQTLRSAEDFTTRSLYFVNDGQIFLLEIVWAELYVEDAQPGKSPRWKACYLRLWRMYDV
ncbi:uncharacterized protein IWZ02DRAFT_429566 [Phyllosticta citriasiana]|uniref:uncharacterized protein n=1 Tax=Phyllosticta citriasiana TaxID=595635 RepID=UPI0030FD5A1D